MKTQPTTNTPSLKGTQNTQPTTNNPFVEGSQNSRLLRALSRGQKISPAQARSRFGITNVSARVREMRIKGFNIVTNYRTYNDGTRKAFYTLA